MILLPDPLAGGFPMPQIGQLVVAIGVTPPQMVTAAAVLALRGPVRVVVGGNRFNAHQLAREIRRHTIQMDAVLARITVARGFTCYQVVALLADLVTEPAIPDTGEAETTVSAAPVLVCDLLTTFADEAVATVDAYHLLRQAVGYLQASRVRGGGVLVSLTPPPQPDRAGLVNVVTAVADVCYHVNL